MLSEFETTLLIDTFDLDRPDSKRSATEELKPPLTVHDVVLHCGEWFPREIDQRTVAADISALVKAAVLKVESAKDTEDTGK